MSGPIDFLPTMDPLLRNPRLEHAALLPVLGLPTRFESNSRRVIDIVERSFGQWETIGPAFGDAANPFRVRVVVHDGPEDADWPRRVRYIAPDAIRIIAQSSGSIAISDPERRESVAYVSATAVADCEHFQSAFLEATTLALLAHFDRHPVHASAVALHGRAVLLAGASGAGKSTLAHLAHTAGIDVMSEDRVWVQLDPSLRIWGWPGHAKLRVAGESAKRLVPLAVSGRARCHRADSAVVCVLARGVAASLERIDSAAVCAALTHDVAPGFDRFPVRHRACAEALAAPGGWRLTLSSDPRDALPLVQSMLHETPNPIAPM